MRIILRRRNHSNLHHNFRSLLRARPRRARTIFRQSTMLITTTINMKQGRLQGRMSIPNICLRQIRSHIINHVSNPPRITNRLLSLTNPRTTSQHMNMRIRAHKHTSQGLPHNNRINRITTITSLGSHHHTFTIRNINSIARPQRSFKPRPRLLIRQGPTTTSHHVNRHDRTRTTTNRQCIMVLRLLHQTRVTTRQLRHHQASHTITRHCKSWLVKNRGQ